MKQELIFVYNANSSVFSQLGDLVHKTISPKTYGCNLCGLTYRGASMKEEWKEFIGNLSVKTTFLHKDEFVKLYPRYALTQYPVVFSKEGEKLTEFITPGEINKQESLGKLKQLVMSKLTSL